MAAGAAVVVLTLYFRSPGASPDLPPASAASVELLERAALAAATTPQTQVRTGQYSYVKTVGHTSVLSETKSGKVQLLRESEAMEQWTSVDGSEWTLQRKGGSDDLLPGTPGRGSLNAPTYDFLAALPADPDALLKQVRDDAGENHGAGSDSTTGPGQESFVTIGDLLRSGVTPPDATASLYRAAALIPGVAVVPETADAAGRKGSPSPEHTMANVLSGSSTRARPDCWVSAQSSWRTTPGVRPAPSSAPSPSSTAASSTRPGELPRGPKGSAMHRSTPMTPSMQGRTLGRS
ncbi:CU044_5270 family protein [Streptomyces sp. NPDC019990]|uniref:CU044_5270 family protein n=1 Tax=Streptomyces sp. NPDC019990 TaxID=3154693 RepID=UPI0033C08C58